MKKLLLIDDDTLAGQIYATRLQLEGFQVEQAFDAEAGLRVLARGLPDLIILDLLLPGMNGVEFLKKIRGRPETRGLPVIALTNAYLTNLVDQARQAGANACLSKSNARIADILEAIEKELNPEVTAPTAGTGFVSGQAEESEEAFQRELKRDLQEQAAGLMQRCSSLLQSLAGAAGTEFDKSALTDLFRVIHSFAANAALAQSTQAARLAGAAEALVKEMMDKSGAVTASAVRTVTQAVSSLTRLVEQAGSGAEGTQFRVLAVDDDPIALRAITSALGKVGVKPELVEDPLAVEGLLNQANYDLLITDINMPELNGLDLCKRVRTMPGYRSTPIVLVTALTDFRTRLMSASSGADDFIAKPFLFMELAVKCLIYLLERPGPAAIQAFKPFHSS